MIVTGTKYDSIDWAALEHAYGSADDLPPILMDLTDPEKAAEAIDQLWIGPFHQETLYTATGPAMAIAAHFLAEGKCPFPEELSELLFAFAKVVEIDNGREDDEDTIGIIALCQRALADSAEFLLPCVSEDGPIAWTAIGFQKYHPRRDEESVPALVQRLLAKDNDIALLCGWMLGSFGVAPPQGIPSGSACEEIYLLGSAFSGWCPAEKTADLAHNFEKWAPLLAKIAGGEQQVGSWLAEANLEAATCFLGAAPPHDPQILGGLTHVVRSSRRWGPVAARAVVAHVMNPQCSIDPADLIRNLRQLPSDDAVREALLVAAQRCETAGPWPSRVDSRTDVVMSLLEAGDPRWEDVLEKFIRGNHPHKSYTSLTSVYSLESFHSIFHRADPQPSRRVVAAVVDAIRAGDNHVLDLLLLIAPWPREVCAQAIPFARERLLSNPLSLLTVLARWGDKESLPLIEIKLKGVELNEFQQLALSVLRGDADPIELDMWRKNASRLSDINELYATVFSESDWKNVPLWKVPGLVRSAAEYVDQTGKWGGTAESFIDLILLGCKGYPLEAIALAEKSLALEHRIQREVARLVREEIARDRRLPSIGFAAIDDEIFLSRARALLAQLESN